MTREESNALYWREWGRILAAAEQIEQTSLTGRPSKT
jgi:hypothetical protein